MVSWFRQSIWPAASQTQCSLWETSEKLCLLCVFRARTEYFREQICIFLSCRHTASKSGFGKFQHKSFGYSLEKSERLCLLFFREWENPELLRGFLYFWYALLILMIFWNKYGTAVTVGRYDSKTKCLLMSYLPGAVRSGTGSAGQVFILHVMWHGDSHHLVVGFRLRFHNSAALCHSTTWHHGLFCNMAVFWYSLASADKLSPTGCVFHIHSGILCYQ